MASGEGNGRLFSIVAAIVAGAGTLGWATFLGGAIRWISLGEAELPRAESVAKIPPSVLIATGAEFLAFAAVAVIVILAVLYLLDVRLRLPLRLGLTPAHMRESAERERGLEERLEERREASDAARMRARMAAGDEDRDEAERTLRDAETAVSEARAAAIEETRPERGERVLGLAIGAPTAALAVATALLVDLGYGLPPAWSIPVVLVLATFAGWVTATLYSRALRRGRSRGASFAAMGVAVLVAVPLVMAFATYARAGDAPRVQPAALLLADGTPLAAFFLAETGDKVFVGTFPETERVDCEAGPEVCKAGEPRPRVTVPARLLSLPAAEVRNLTVGPGLPLAGEDAEQPDEDGPEGVPRTAREWALVAAINLCGASRRSPAAREEAAGATNGSEAEAAAGEDVTSPCSAEARERLTRALGREQDAIASGGRAGSG